MIQPGLYNIGADRWVACIRVFALLGVNLTGAAFAAQVRVRPDASGAALVSLVTQTTDVQGVRLLYGGTDTIANHITAGRLASAPEVINPATGELFTDADSVALSQLRLRIDETTMEGLPEPAETGGDVELAWDMHITPSGGLKDKYIGGTFTVRAGVTQ